MGSRHINSIPSSACFHNALWLNPTVFGHCLKNIKFPADKNQLLAYAMENKAPQNIIFILNKFSDRNYRNAIDLFKEFWTLV
jgi:hypothetical protein